MRTVDIALMRQRGLSIAEIAKKSGISSKEVSDRLKAYEHDGRGSISEKSGNHNSRQQAECMSEIFGNGHGGLVIFAFVFGSFGYGIDRTAAESGQQPQEDKYST